ncbi:MAG: 16S rRNA (guanine(527)-N(7))-methyltransferase RsmG [Burkholderiaceae bacterium]|nr:16S rRNA (guanine(527)-N(7))-methyltransferase RsmG [Burkholderiaceae bacterium]
MSEHCAGPGAELDALRQDASALGLALPEPAFDRLVRYLALLRKWNAAYNLTAVRDPTQMRVQHLADCLATVAPLRREVGKHGEGLPLRILDVGSGGGLPGVVLAIVEPAWDVSCVDTVGKKAAFIRQAAGELALPNLYALHARVEALPGPPFDLITARAFASLPDFVRLTRPRLAPGGVWMAMKGRRPDDEIAALPDDIEVFHVEPLAVPGLAAERCLVWMRPR